MVSFAYRVNCFARRGARIRWYAGKSETDASGCKKTIAVRIDYFCNINRAAHPTGPMTPTLPHDPTPDTLVQLLDRVATEDAAALRALYDLTSSKLFGLALRILVKREWAEEVLQDAFVNIWRYAGDYKAGLSAPMTWMAAIVRNRALDYLRRQKANGASAETEWSDALDDTLPTNEADPSEQMLMSQEARQLAICMERLEANQRQAVALAYLRDQSHSEVADVLKVPLGTVKSWIRRGLEKLKTCLGGL
jgi:RNA polymerase sigma-70 factor (ECF subfamily)